MRFIDLFAGAGGMTIGLKAAGHEHLLGVEWDERAANTYRCAGLHGVHGDVRDDEVFERIVAACEGRPLDLLVGGPPCQAFSAAGKREGAYDERNGWPWFMSVVLKLRSRGLGPTWIICENVRGMLAHRKKVHRGLPRNSIAPDPLTCPRCYWDVVLVPGFCEVFSWVDWWELDAADYGVPQRRHRIFLVGGPQAAPVPEPTHSQAALVRAKWSTGEYWERMNLEPVGVPSSQEERVLKSLGPDDGKKPWKTIRQALGMCVDSPSPTVGATDFSSWSRDTIFSPSARVIGGGSNPHGPGLGHERNFRDLTDEPSVTMAAVQVGNRGPWMVAVRHQSPSAGTVQRPVDETSPTVGVKGVLYGESQEEGGPTNAAYLGDKSKRRRLTPEECAALQDFPADWPFQGPQTSKYRQVGNAVPPGLAEAIGRVFREL